MDGWIDGWTDGWMDESQMMHHTKLLIYDKTKRKRNIYLYTFWNTYRKAQTTRNRKCVYIEKENNSSILCILGT